MLQVVNEYESLFRMVPGSLESRYIGSGTENRNVTLLTVENREEVVSEISRMRSGMRYVSGPTNVGKTIQFTKMLADQNAGMVVVVEPTSALAANAAYSFNKVHGEDLAAASTCISPFYGAHGNIIFMCAEVFNREHAFGQKLVSVGMVVVDECHSETPDQRAALEVAKVVAKELPVVAMSGTVHGVRTAHSFEGIELKGFVSADVAPKGVRMIFHESAAEARKAKGPNDFVLSVFSSYANCKSMYEACLKGGEVDIHADYRCSEGFNFPVGIVIDCRKKLVIDEKEGELVLKRTQVTTSEHIQRAKRLRDSGVYHGADVERLATKTIVDESSEGEKAMVEWWKRVLKLPSNPDEALRKFSVLLDGQFNIYSLTTKHCKGLEWYEDESGDEDPGTVTRDEVEDTICGDEIPETAGRKEKRGLDPSSIIVMNEKDRGEAPSEKRRENGVRNRVGVEIVRQIPWTPEDKGNEILCYLFQDESQVLPDPTVTGWMVERLAHGAELHLSYSLKGLATLVALRNHYLRVYRNCKSKVAVRNIGKLSKMYRDHFSLGVEQEMWGEVKFVYADKKERLAEVDDVLYFLEETRSSINDDKTVLFQTLFGEG